MTWYATHSLSIAQLLLGSREHMYRADPSKPGLTFNWTWHMCAVAVYSRIYFYLKKQAQA